MIKGAAETRLCARRTYSRAPLDPASSKTASGPVECGAHAAKVGDQLVDQLVLGMPPRHELPTTAATSALEHEAANLAFTSAAAHGHLVDPSDVGRLGEHVFVAVLNPAGEEGVGPLTQAEAARPHDDIAGPVRWPTTVDREAGEIAIVGQKMEGPGEEPDRPSPLSRVQPASAEGLLPTLLRALDFEDPAFVASCRKDVRLVPSDEGLGPRVQPLGPEGIAKSGLDFAMPRAFSASIHNERTDRLTRGSSVPGSVTLAGSRRAG
jgi:hypothetical protein